LRQNLFRAGHAHVGVLLVLSLVVLRYVDEARLSNGWKTFVRSSAPSAAILLPVGFFFSILSPAATTPKGLINACFIGAALLAAGLFTLGVGLLRAGKSPKQGQFSGHSGPRENGDVLGAVTGEWSRLEI
jgi:hypothetical protein